LEFRNQVLRYLVQEKGFTAIALESGLVESRKVYDYVRGGAGELASVLAEGISWTFDRLPQNATLVSWLKDYNSDPQHTCTVNFYGFDVPGSPRSWRRLGISTAWIARRRSGFTPRSTHSWQAFDSTPIAPRARRDTTSSAPQIETRSLPQLPI
jgi:erythromycin esterase